MQFIDGMPRVLRHRAQHHTEVVAILLEGPGRMGDGDGVRHHAASPPLDRRLESLQTAETHLQFAVFYSGCEGVEPTVHLPHAAPAVRNCCRLANSFSTSLRIRLAANSYA